MAFREVGVHEIREVLRLRLRGEGLRSAARLARRSYLMVVRGVGGGFLDVPEWGASVERGGDERVLQGVRSDFLGPACR